MKKVTYKSQEEIQILREGGKILATILDELKNIAQTQKVSGVALNKKAEELAKKHGVKPSFKGFNGYPASVIVSVNDEVVHGIPKDDLFQEGDLVSLDFGVWHKELCTDHAITFGVGSISEQEEKLLKITKESLYLGIDQAVIGNTMYDIAEAIEDHIKPHNFGIVRDLVGHGVGYEVHEAPQVPNFTSRDLKKVPLKEGLVIAIEPMVSLGSHSVILQDDQWTIATADGSKAAHFEHTVAITSDGPQILTQLP